MSSIAQQPIYNRSVTSSRANISEVARQVLALRSVSNVAGYQTGRTIQVLLDKLTPAELVQLGEMFLKNGVEEAP